MKRRRTPRCLCLMFDGEPVTVRTNGHGHRLTPRTLDALHELVKHARKKRAREAT